LIYKSKHCEIEAYVNSSVIKALHLRDTPERAYKLAKAGLVLETSQDPSVSPRRYSQASPFTLPPGVSGSFVRQTLKDLNYRSVYLIAGPQVHATMLKSGCVDELFLTTHFTLLGGTKISGLLDADLPKPQVLTLMSTY